MTWRKLLWRGLFVVFLVKGSVLALSERAESKFLEFRHRRASALLTDEFQSISKQNIFPKVLNKKRIRYYVLQSRHVDRVDMRLDFETAAYVWLKALGLHDVLVEQVHNPEEASIVIHYGSRKFHGADSPDSLSPFDTAAHYFLDSDFFSSKEGQEIPVIELNSHPKGVNKGYVNWTTIEHCYKKNAVIVQKRNGAETLVSVESLFGSFRDPQKIAEYILETKPTTEEGESVEFKNSKRWLMYWTFLHEIGHIFGLDDLYWIRKENLKVPRYKSVMKSGKWRPMYPTAIDVQRARRNLEESGLCERLLTHK